MTPQMKQFEVWALSASRLPFVVPGDPAPNRYTPCGAWRAAQIAGSAFAILTEREREVLELIARGHDNGQIASQLSLSTKTVRNHINNIFSKLDIPNRAQAIVRARDVGFGCRPS